MAKRIRFTVNGIECYAALQENPLTEKIVAMCPFTMEYTRSGEHEYYAALPERATAKGCPSTTKGHRNGLYYFEGWNALSIVFRDCDTSPFSINHIGDFEGDISALLEKSSGKIQILCEAE